MRYGSVCSGIEAATVAWHPLGWEAAWYSEIEPFPSAVLSHHYPATPNLGDMTKIRQRSEFNDAAIDVLVGGTPCQSFSVAGLRKGLADPRGNLALEFLALADLARPAWVVWENVPGVLSSNGGRDFGAFLGGLGQLGYGFAYRVLDAQFFGVAQRRRRVFVVGHLGDWRAAAAVLFERDSLSGNPAPRREAGEGFTHSLAPSLTASGRGVGRTGDIRGQDPVVAMCLNAKGGAGRMDAESETLFDPALRGEGFDASEDGTGRGTPLVPVAFNHHKSGNTGSSLGVSEDRVDCLRADTKSPFAIAFDCKASGQNGFGIGQIAGTQRAMGHANSHTNGGGHQAVMAGSAVRRLTPEECESLQGLPRGYTRIPWRNKPAELCPDGPRYKAIGNSMARPVMRWIGERIDQVQAVIRKEKAA